MLDVGIHHGIRKTFLRTVRVGFIITTTCTWLNESHSQLIGQLIMHAKIITIKMFQRLYHNNSNSSSSNNARNTIETEIEKS